MAMKKTAALKSRQNLLFCLALLGAPLGAPQAHITLETPQASVGRSYKAVLRIGHGCEGAATTAVRVQIPEGMLNAKPQPKPGWELATKQGAYAKPHSLYGSKIESGVREISWSGGALPDGYYDEFVFVAYLSGELSPGTSLYLPVIQQCGAQLQRWIDIPSGAPSHDHSDTPAPALQLLPKQP